MLNMDDHLHLSLSTLQVIYLLSLRPPWPDSHHHCPWINLVHSLGWSVEVLHLDKTPQA